MKPIKDTKLGQWLKNKAPKVLETVGDLLPDNGALGIVKRLIDNEPEISHEDKLEYYRLQTQFEIEIARLDQLEMSNVRERETAFIKATGHVDWFMWVFGMLVILLFIFVTIVSTIGNIPMEMRELFIEAKAAVRDMTVMIAAYYWGSSASSRIKDMRK